MQMQTYHLPLLLLAGVLISRVGDINSFINGRLIHKTDEQSYMALQNPDGFTKNHNYPSNAIVK